MTVQSLDTLVGFFIALDILHEEKESHEKRLDGLDESINVIEKRIEPQAIMAMRELGVEEKTIKDKLYFHFKGDKPLGDGCFTPGDYYLHIDPINVENSKSWHIGRGEVGKFIHHYLLREYQRFSKPLFTLGGAILGGVLGYVVAYKPEPVGSPEFLIGVVTILIGAMGYTYAAYKNVQYYENLSGRFKPLYQGTEAIKTALKRVKG